MNIVLIGYRGSGKSSVGKVLAGKMGCAFVDTDERVVREAGRTIREIFAAEGEAGFRDRETRAIASAMAQDQQVIAAGGGAVLRPENVAALRRGRVVWLRASPEALYIRICADAATNATRPNLTAAGGLEEVRALLARRTPLYEAAAECQVDVERLSVEEAAARVIAALGVMAC